MMYGWAKVFGFMDGNLFSDFQEDRSGAGGGKLRNEVQSDIHLSMIASDIILLPVLEMLAQVGDGRMGKHV